MTKGLILLGGAGTRLHPATKAISKQLIPLYDKPMCYYSISTLLLAKIKDILIISTPQDTPLYQKLFEDGSQWGINIQYIVQQSPEGLPQAFTLGEQFLGTDNCCLVLGDNVFYGGGLSGSLQRAKQNSGMTVFGYHVSDPHRFGIVEFDKNGSVLSIEEKPSNPKSNWALVGLYFCDNDVINIAKNLQKSPRGEYEITDVMKAYLARQKLQVEKLPRGTTWLDTGTFDSLLQASHFVQTIQQRQGLSVCCPEEICHKNGWINDEQLDKIAESMKNNAYGKYLKGLLDED